MDATEIYQSQWLKASDIGEKQLEVEIDKVNSFPISENETKLEVHFTEIEKSLLLNKTNAMRLIEAFGKETDNWAGNKIVLYTAQVSFKGEEVPALRVRAISPQ